MKRFEKFRHLEQRVRELEQENDGLMRQLEERKLAEKAKGILMRLLHLDEDEAYHRMRKYASDHNMKLVDV